MTERYTRRIQGFYKRWNITLDRGQEFERFKNRVLAAIDQTVGGFILGRPSICQKFAFHLGHRQPVRSMTGAAVISQVVKTSGLLGHSLDQTATYSSIESCPDDRELIFSLQCLFWILADQKCPNLGRLVQAIRGAVDASPLIDVRIAKRGNRVTLYPAGARLLDEAVVNETLAWLGRHATIAKHFENALEICVRKDTAHYRNVLDELRSALEKLVRSVLGNRKSLENQREPLLRWMEDRGAHVQVRNLYRQLLTYYIQYQNDAVKHGDGWAEREIEYMIYLTGTFMRFLLQLHDAPAASTRSP